MKRLLLPLLAALSLQGGAIAETYYRWSEDPMNDKRSLQIGLREANGKGLIKIGCYPTNKAKYNLFGEIEVNEVIDSEDGSKFTWITWRFDKQEPVKDIKDIKENDYKTLLMRERGRFGKNKEVKYFVDWFRYSDKMLLRYQSWINGPQTLTFNVSELKPLIERGEKEGCDWGRGTKR